MKNVLELATLLSEGSLITDKQIIQSYRYDRSNAPAGMPIAVIRAKNVSDVVNTLRWANSNKVPVVTRGAGTSLAGCALAIEGGLVLSTELMTALSIDPIKMQATVEPGVINKQLKDEARKYGLYYPPDPSSFEISSIGGNIATNAGGICCVKYGVTGDYVLSIDVVLSTGELLTLGTQNIKDVAGYNLKSLFVGSEGTLGVIVKACLKLVPLPPDPITIVCYFDQLSDVSMAIQKVRTQFSPSALELMDKRAISAVERVTKMGLDCNSEAMLIIRTEQFSDKDKKEQLLQIVDNLEQSRAKEIFYTDDFVEGELFMAARRQAIPAVEKSGPVLIEDIGVPIYKITDLLDGISRIADCYGIDIATIGHAGDGNFHPLIPFTLGDLQNSDSMKAFGQIMDLAISLGGTITGEHGVGTLKRPWLAKQLGARQLEIIKQIKAIFDPNNVLNPDKAL